MTYKILIIDDDDDDFFILSTYLKSIEDFKVECHWESNVEEAYRKMISNEYDIYFVDYLLGAVNGLELIQKSLDHNCIKPTILLSGKGNKEIDQNAIKLGVYDFLIKGEISVDKLERCIRYTVQQYAHKVKLIENERKYRQIFVNAISYIVICDEDFKIIESNDAVNGFIGYDKEEVVSTHFFHYIDKNSLLNDCYIHSLNPDNLSNFKADKIKFIHKDGSIRIGQINFNRYEGSFDNKNYWQAVVYDETIREQKEIERIHTEKLNAVHRLINTLAHEIRNPLTNIQLASESIELTSKTANHEFVAIIKRGVKRINDIITNLMNSSKSLKMYFEPTNLKELLNESVQVARDSSTLKNVVIETKFTEEDCIHMIDVHKFKIALINLIGNAIEATNKQESFVSVSLLKIDNRINIHIEDNGIGISEENIGKIFEPYFTTKNAGTGLGLASTLNIIRSHDAKIDVTSQLNKGTVFRIVL